MTNQNSREILLTSRFKKDLAQLARRYRSIRKDLNPLIEQLQRGEDILVLTAPQRDRVKLMTVIRNAHTIIAGPSSYNSVQEAIATAKADLIRLPEVICSDKYINPKSISLLKKELL